MAKSGPRARHPVLDLGSSRSNESVRTGFRLLPKLHRPRLLTPVTIRIVKIDRTGPDSTSGSQPSPARGDWGRAVRPPPGPQATDSLFKRRCPDRTRPIAERPPITEWPTVAAISSPARNPTAAVTTRPNSILPQAASQPRSVFYAARFLRQGGGGAPPCGSPQLFTGAAFRGFREAERPGHPSATSKQSRPDV